MITDGFDIRKAAQVAAYFARAEGGRINVLKLIKLIYLADREFANRYDEPMLCDHLVSMDHGPVDSGTLDMVNGVGEPNDDWDEFIGMRVGHDIAVARPLSDEDLDELSVAEFEVLTYVWETLGHMGRYQLRDYTHKHCPEWENPGGSSCPIPYARLFKFLGKVDAEDLAGNIDTNRALKRAFGRYANATEEDISAF